METLSSMIIARSNRNQTQIKNMCNYTFKFKTLTKTDMLQDENFRKGRMPMVVAFRKNILIYLRCDKNTVALASVCFAISF